MEEAIARDDIDRGAFEAKLKEARSNAENADEEIRGAREG